MKGIAWFLGSKPIPKVLRICALTLVCLAMATPAYADGWGGWGGWGGGGGGGGGAPEIDPSSMAAALTLLSGGVLVLTDRFRKK
jgi:hypothetical protein